MFHRLQGDEAGGHGRRFASTMSFVPEAADCIRDLCRNMGKPEVPLLAAGGIADARQVCTATYLMLLAIGEISRKAEEPDALLVFDLYSALLDPAGNQQ